MGMQLILAEKPSVAKNIADALGMAQGRYDGYFEGNGFIITWAFGHLIELYDSKDYDAKYAEWRMEHFPFVPERFKYKVKTEKKVKDGHKVSQTDPGAKKQIELIKRLVERNDVELVIVATDADREGELISSLIMSFVQVKKPVFRILLNEWTPNEVRKGLQKLIPIEKMKSLQQAGLARQQADWLIGINLTSVATIKYGGRSNVLNIGRVLLPTLKLIYDRDKEIANFTPVPYFKLNAVFSEGTVKYEGTYFEMKDGKVQDIFEKREPLGAILNGVQSKTGQIIEKQVVEKLKYPSSLFNLSALQGFITSQNSGWDSDKVLKVTQSLYEKKLVTYPRTASTALEESLIEKAKAVLEVHKKGLPFEDEVQFHQSKRVFNNAKVESHSAIIPTYMLPKDLTKDEFVVYTAIRNRFLAQFMPPAKIEETLLITQVESWGFISKGKVQKELGYKKVEPDNSREDITLPDVEKGFQSRIIEATVDDYKTKPPAPYIEKTLLSAMEFCGKQFKEDEHESSELMSAILGGFSIGTPATRAETLKKLETAGYMCKEKKNLHCTPKGKYLIETFPIKELMDLEYTGRLEKTLADIEKGAISKKAFDQFIKQFVVASVEIIKQQQISEAAMAPVSAAEEPIGMCPLCGKPIREWDKSFGCTGYKEGCPYTIWKSNKVLEGYKKKVTKSVAKMLIKNGEAEIKNVEINGKKRTLLLTNERNAEGRYGIRVKTI